MRCLSVFWLHSKYVPLDLCLLMHFLGQQGNVDLEGAFLQSEEAFLQSQGVHSPS